MGNSFVLLEVLELAILMFVFSEVAFAIEYLANTT
jgi:hypothetical protein